MKKKPTKPKRGRPFAGGRDPMRSLRISDELWQAAQEAAAAEGVPVSEWVRSAMERRLRRLRR